MHGRVFTRAMQASVRAFPSFRLSLPIPPLVVTDSRVSVTTDA
jgi:hypothetical protein